MIFISRDLLKLTGNEHDIVVETVTVFMEVFDRLSPNYKEILLLTLAHQLEKINVERKESNNEND